MGKKRLRLELRALELINASLTASNMDMWTELQEWRDGRRTLWFRCHEPVPEPEALVCSGRKWEVCGRELLPVWEVNAGVPGQRLTSYPDPRFATPCATMTGCGRILVYGFCQPLSWNTAGHTHPCVVM